MQAMSFAMGMAHIDMPVALRSQSQATDCSVQLQRAGTRVQAGSVLTSCVLLCLTSK